MPRLSAIRPRLQEIGNRPRSKTRARSPDQCRDDDQPWRAWYKTAEWRRLRLLVFERDLFTCKRTGVFLSGKHPAPNSPVANHKTPHHGDWNLFWDIDNIETVSKAVHDSDIQKQEKASLGRW